MIDKASLWALDFDGVICDSAIETGLSGWAVAAKQWPKMPTKCPDDMLDAFRAVRPVMETGFEAILIMRLLFEGVETEALLNDFNLQLDALIERDKLSTNDLKAAFGAYRDQWIERDLESWIRQNPLFDGIKPHLKSLHASDWLIITTKQQRFVEYILEANEISCPTAIYGLEDGRGKPEILSELVKASPQRAIIFVEDRLPTLMKVMQENALENIELWLADWGYNTHQDKLMATESERLQLKSLKALVDWE